MTRVLDVSNLRVSFPGANHTPFYPVDGVSFSLQRGETPDCAPAAGFGVAKHA